RNQLPAIVRGALNAYTPGSGLARGTNAVSMSAPPSCAMTIRIWTIAAFVTGFRSGLWSNRTATVATLLDLISVWTGSNTSSFAPANMTLVKVISTAAAAPLRTSFRVTISSTNQPTQASFFAPAFSDVRACGDLRLDDGLCQLRTSYAANGL